MSALLSIAACAACAALGVFFGCWCGFRVAVSSMRRKYAALPAYESDHAWLRGRARRAARRMAAQLAKEFDKPHLESVLAGPFRQMILEEFDLPAKGLER